MPFSKDRETTFPNSCERIDLMDQREMVRLLHMLDFAKTKPKLREPLYQLFKYGPIDDGGVMSKSARDALYDVGACVKITVKGEDGFNACSYFGRSLYRIYEWLYGKY